MSHVDTICTNHGFEICHQRWFFSAPSFPLKRIGCLIREIIHAHTFTRNVCSVIRGGVFLLDFRCAINCTTGGTTDARLVEGKAKNSCLVLLKFLSVICTSAFAIEEYHSQRPRIIPDVLTSREQSTTFTETEATAAC